MALVDPSTLPGVLDADVVSDLADRIVSVANTVIEATSGAKDRWSGLRDVFDVSGAEGVHAMLDRPATDATDFAAALATARAALVDAATHALPDLKRRRDELATRIGTVNAGFASAEESWQSADRAFWVQSRASDDLLATDLARLTRLRAGAGRTAAAEAGDILREDIERLRRDIEDAEDRIASQLRAITGGTEVHGAWGQPVRVSQTSWGFIDAPYPGAVTTTLSLAQRLEHSLSDAVAARIGWLGTADPAAVRAWTLAHPDFASAVGFVDPDRAARVWADLSDHSTAAGDGRWDSGPLAQLLALAPLAVGNLNGIPATQRNRFTREGLAQLLARTDLDSDARKKLESVSDFLSTNADASLLSVFLDTDGEPRASVAFGDVDTADQITTMSHGIQTDLGSLREWRNSALNVRQELRKQLAVEGRSIQTSVVLFMEWDSGDALTVWGIDRPDAGAARLSQLLSGFAQNNPASQRNLVLHSLGTTMGAQAIADNPGLVNNAWFLGSAGITDEASRGISAQIAGGGLTVQASHATADVIAPFGRIDGLSAHSTDPRTVAGVGQFGADGGFVAEYGPGGQQGEPTEGHNAQRSTEMLYWSWTTGPDGSPIPDDTESTGYLDRSAESFLHLIVGLSDALEPQETR